MVKPTCATFGKKHFRKCVASTSLFFICVKHTHKLRDFSTIAPRGREDNKVPSNAPNLGATKRNRFYIRQAEGAKSGDDSGKLWFSLFSCYGFLLMGKYVE